MTSLTDEQQKAILGQVVEVEHRKRQLEEAQRDLQAMLHLANVQDFSMVIIPMTPSPALTEVSAPTEAKTNGEAVGL